MRWFYNEAMTKTSLPALVVAFAGLLAAGSGIAQTPTPAPAPEASKQLEQRIERIRVEDGGSRIDELRVGGQTQSITVSPKGSLPSYDVLPASANRAPSAGERNSASSSGGTRVWKVLGF
jgi:hypothetical protein